MADVAPDLARPQGRYGVDGDYRLIPAAVVFACYALLCLTAGGLAVGWLASGHTAAGLTAAVVALALIAQGLGIARFSRRGKFEVWARLL